MMLKKLCGLLKAVHIFQGIYSENLLVNVCLSLTLVIDKVQHNFRIDLGIQIKWSMDFCLLEICMCLKVPSNI